MVGRVVVRFLFWWVRHSVFVSWGYFTVVNIRITYFSEWRGVVRG